MITTVVVPVDSSALAERAVAPAVAIARRAGAGIELLTVVHERQESRDVDRVAAVAAAHGATHRVVRGADAARVIVDVARQGASIVMASHARTGVGEAIFGSTAEAVVRRAGVPIVLVGPRGGGVALDEGSRMLVCLDGSLASESILPVAVEWSEMLGLVPWLVHAGSESFDVIAQRSGAPGPDVEPDAYLANVAERLAHEGVESGWDALFGPPAHAIADYAASPGVALLAMTTHGRTGLARVAAGSVTMRVVHEVTQPVLVLRPPGLPGT